MNKTHFAAIPFLFLLRFGLTISSYGTGAAGGIFASLLVLGALVGLGLGDIAPRIESEPGLVAVVGMAAYFTAIVSAPLTGILLITETTGSYEQISLCWRAVFVPTRLQSTSSRCRFTKPYLNGTLNGAELARLRPGPSWLIFKWKTRSICRKARARVRITAGLRVGAVPCSHGREWVPTANARLAADMRIIALIAPEADSALETLRRGCSSRLDYARIN
jgi:CIC family chloride channel protein